MGSTLGQLKTKLTYSLGTAETNLLTTDKRTDAINEAIRDILRMYPVLQYTIAANVSFTSGTANLPTDCLQPMLLRNTSSSIDYELVDFDRFNSNLSNTYKIYYDTGSSLEKMKIYPADTVTLEFTYVQLPAELSLDGDTVRFNYWWDKAIAEKAAEQLMLGVQNFSGASAKSQEAANQMAKAWQIERARLQGSETTRLQSVYEKNSFLQSSNRLRN